MIVEYIRYNIALSRADDFLAAYDAASKSMEASIHCLGYELSRGVDAPESFVLRIQWDSAEGHMVGFRKSPEFRSFFVAVQPFVQDIVEMRHYEPTSLRWSRP